MIITFLIILYPIIFITSIIFTKISHPLAIGLRLLLQTVLICCSSGLNNISFWFSYILFLIFLGGILVLFVYVTSLASNEMFKINLLSVLFILPMFLLIVILLSIDPIIIPEQSMFKIALSFKSVPYSPDTSLIATIYNYTNINLTIFMVFYLLLTLVVVVKVTHNFFGPLRLSTN